MQTVKWKVVDSAVILEEEKETLKNTWMSMQAMQELIKNGVDASNVLNRYQKHFTEFNETWTILLKKYFEKDYTAGADGQYNWRCDFGTNTIYIEERVV